MMAGLMAGCAAHHQDQSRSVDSAGVARADQSAAPSAPSVGSDHQHPAAESSPPQSQAQPGTEPGTAPTTQPSGSEANLRDSAPSDETATGSSTPTTQAATTQELVTDHSDEQTSSTPAAEVAESPRQVLAGVMNATFRGDAEGVRSRLLAQDESSQRLAKAMVDVALAAQQVRQATVDKFGAEEARKLDVDVVPPVVIASAVEQIDNDRATVKLQGRNGIAFQLVDGSWKMSLAEVIAQQGQGRDLNELINQTRQPVLRFAELARQVNEGKFANVEEVMAELAQAFFGSQSGK